jgi:hypothetical protein
VECGGNYVCGGCEVMKSNYVQIARAVGLRLPFVGNSSRGVLGQDDDGYYYRVYSYRTLIAEMRGSDMWVSDVKYSQTTSRIQNIVRREWGV